MIFRAVVKDTNYQKYPPVLRFTGGFALRPGVGQGHPVGRCMPYFGQIRKTARRDRRLTRHLKEQ
jgi:hypothetical protein